MSPSKKIIKLLAEVIAVSLILLIVYGLASLIYGVSFVFGNSNKYESNITLINNNMIDKIDNFIFKIDTDRTSITIKKSDSFNVETNNKNISINYDNKTDTISIKEKKLKMFNVYDIYDMTIYIPPTLFKEVDINSGAGDITIDTLTTNKLDLNANAGKISIDNLTVYMKANIHTGVGRVNINGPLINNLKLTSGVGETNIKANLNGNNYLSSGVGNINLEALQKRNLYTFNATKGVGDIIIDGEKVKSGTNGSGPIKINLESGIGKIDIKCKNEEVNEG